MVKVAASKVIDLWFVVCCLLSIGSRALFGIVPTLATSETSIVAVTVFYDRLLAKSLSLCACLAVAATVPYWLVLCWSWLPAAQLLRIRLLVVLLWLELPLVIVVSRLVLTLSNECLIHQGLEVREVQHAQLASEGMSESSKKAVYLPFVSSHIM
jgi:hypothetical protein